MECGVQRHTSLPAVLERYASLWSIVVPEQLLDSDFFELTSCPFPQRASISAANRQRALSTAPIRTWLTGFRNPRAETATETADLTPREREVLGLICEGLDDKVIAKHLSLSGNTVRNHVAGIYGKIGVNRRAAAIAWARERGFA